MIAKMHFLVFLGVIALSTIGSSATLACSGNGYVCSGHCDGFGAFCLATKNSAGAPICMCAEPRRKYLWDREERVRLYTPWSPAYSHRRI